MMKRINYLQCQIYNSEASPYIKITFEQYFSHIHFNKKDISWNKKRLVAQKGSIVNE